MKFIFFGTPAFAARVLEVLVSAGFIPQAVITNPDKPSGRKQELTPSKIKRLILTNKIETKLFMPIDPKSMAGELTSLSLDLAIVAAYGKILSKEILHVPRLGFIGVHPSLLPKYRGASPIQSAILNGETVSGVTLYLLDEKMDAGPILATGHCPITDNTYAEAESKLAELGGNLLIETLPKFIKGEITPKIQDASLATYTKKFTSEDGFVDLEKDDSIVIERKIRALNPEPGVWTRRNSKRVKLLKAKLIDGKLKLEVFQVEGKKPSIVVS